MLIFLFTSHLCLFCKTHFDSDGDNICYPKIMTLTFEVLQEEINSDAWNLGY